jgi:2-phosphoglycerate kinase
MSVMKRRIILIGGMPTVGKSTIAQALSRHYDLPYISTDQIRVIMEGTVKDTSEYPLLFNEEGHTAESFLNNYTADEIATLEYNQADEVWPVIRNFIEHDWVWRQGMIVEGVNIVPHLVVEPLRDSIHVQTLFLSDKNQERTREVVFSRGLFGPAASYSDSVKDKEVEWVNLFNQRICNDARQYGCKMFDTNKTQKDVYKIIAWLDEDYESIKANGCSGTIKI